MINQEEYEVLKGLDDKWKLIARDRDTELWVYTKKPYKGMHGWGSGGHFNLLPHRSKYLFQFIQWKDEEPYEIAELIEEYEFWNRTESEEIEMKKDIEWAKKEVKELMTEESQNYPHDEMVEKEIVLGILNQLDEPESIKQFDEESFRDWITINLMSANVLTYSMRSAEMSGDELEDFLVNAVKESLYEESEETEMKSKRELIEKWESVIEATEFYGKGKEERLISYMKGFVSDLNQLDEPEVLSQEWIDKNVVCVRGLGDIIEAEAVENLLVPEQELSVIPKFVADHIELCKSKNKRLNVALSTSPESEMVSEMGVSYEEANEIYARAWLDGFTVKKEQKYYAKIKGHELVNDSEDGYWNVDGNELYIDNIWHDYSGYKTTKLSKYDWNNLGINDDNADFVKVEEVE